MYYVCPLYVFLNYVKVIRAIKTKDDIGGDTRW